MNNLLPLHFICNIFAADSASGQNYSQGYNEDCVRTEDGVPGMSAYNNSTALPPTGGNCSITPPSGISLKTNFNLSCSSWKSNRTPLSYEFQYRLQNGLSSVLYRGANNTISASRIPPGNKADNFTVKFNVTVTDSSGISAPPFPLTVQVGR